MCFNNNLNVYMLLDQSHATVRNLLFHIIFKKYFEVIHELRRVSPDVEVRLGDL